MSRGGRGERDAGARGPARAERKAARRGPAAPPAPALPEVRLAHPAMLLVALLVAAAILLSVTHTIHDPDLWQHLTVGRFIWERHAFPTTQLWTWPTYGAREVDYAWLFEALAWPVWKLGGLLGLQAWRWVATLGVFALAWATARRMGAKGFGALVVVAVAAMVYRARSQVRPETVAVVLLAVELWVLEGWRRGSKAGLWWLVGVAWVWANVHISLWFFFAVLGVHGLGAWGRERRFPGELAWVGLASLGAALVNPWGWRTLGQPVEYWAVWRHELIYQNIGELRPVDWSLNVRNGLPVLVVGWPVLVVGRWGRRGWDVVEGLTCALMTGLLLVGQRFTSFYAVVAAAYVGRDVEAWLGAVRRPGWLRGAWARGGVAAAAVVLLVLPEMSRNVYPIRVRFAAEHFPVVASDFIARHDLHGRMFNPFDFGGYLCFRFWPRRDQLPFMGIHQEGTPELRRLYVLGLMDRAWWPRLVARYAFDFLVLADNDLPTNGVVGFVEADTTWARVFSDDAAHVFVRRHGPFARLAADSAYRVLPATADSLRAMGARSAADSTLRHAATRELWREVAGSPYHAKALDLLATIALSEGRWEDARRELREALRIEPFTVGAREKLGILALQEGRPREALRWFEEERSTLGYRAGLDFRRAQVAAAGGDLARARALYARELGRDAGNVEVRDSLASVSRRLGR